MVINLEKSVATLKGQKLSYSAIHAGKIESATIQWPSGCEKCVTVSVSVDEARVCPSLGTDFAFDATVRAFPINAPIAANGVLTVTIENGDSVNAHTISATVITDDDAKLSGFRESSTYDVASRGTGRPDYSIAVGKGQMPVGPIYTLSDLGELAARLKSIDTFDRRGNIIWLDDFEDNINKWATGGTGVGWSVALSTAAARNGGKSAILTTGNAIGNFAFIARRAPYPVLSKISFEISFVYNANISQYLIDVELYTGALYYRPRLRLAAGLLAILESDGVTWTTIDPAVSLYDGVELFNTVKLVGDYLMGYYTRVILNNREYDVSTHRIQQGGSVVTPHLAGELTVYTAVNSNQSVYVDDAIIKQNEPPND